MEASQDSLTDFSLLGHQRHIYTIMRIEKLQRDRNRETKIRCSIPNVFGLMLSDNSILHRSWSLRGIGFRINRLNALSVPALQFCPRFTNNLRQCLFYLVPLRFLSEQFLQNVQSHLQHFLWQPIVHLSNVDLLVSSSYIFFGCK